ncbi:MAG: hypothetical protein ACPHRO_09750 [Nannocystaceae bacterium]
MGDSGSKHIGDGSIHSTGAEIADVERRESGKRARARDRLMDRATRSYAKTSTLSEAENVENLVLFIDDDLRETAMSIQRIEAYLVETLSLLEQEEVSRAQVSAHVGDQKILDHVDQLNETLESLRRRMARLAASLR